METFPVLLAVCPVTGEFLAQRPVTRSFDVFFDLHLNKRLSKQSWCWCLRRHRSHYDVTIMIQICTWRPIIYAHYLIVLCFMFVILSVVGCCVLAFAYIPPLFDSIRIARVSLKWSLIRWAESVSSKRFWNAFPQDKYYMLVISKLY